MNFVINQSNSKDYLNTSVERLEIFNTLSLPTEVVTFPKILDLCLNDDELELAVPSSVRDSSLLNSNKLPDVSESLSLY